MAFFAVLAHLF